MILACWLIKKIFYAANVSKIVFEIIIEELTQIKPQHRTEGKGLSISHKILKMKQNNKKKNKLG